jgi:hypothetical protein
MEHRGRGLLLGEIHGWRPPLLLSPPPASLIEALLDSVLRCVHGGFQLAGVSDGFKDELSTGKPLLKFASRLTKLDIQSSPSIPVGQRRQGKRPKDYLLSSLLFSVFGWSTSASSAGIKKAQSFGWWATAVRLACYGDNTLGFPADGPSLALPLPAPLLALRRCSCCSPYRAGWKPNSYYICSCSGFSSSRTTLLLTKQRYIFQ